MSTNRQWRLARRPDNAPTPDCFELVEAAVPTADRPGQILIRNRYLSLDPYMRWRMNDAKSYAPPVAIGDPMVGATIAEIIRSDDPQWPAGRMVLAAGGWQDFAVTSAPRLSAIDETVEPAAYLNVLGSPGFTAYAGLMKIGVPKRGETVVVGAATGPVGSMVGQLARRAGCRAVAIAGGPEKCTLAVKHFGFDAAVDHRSKDMAEELAKACPDGIDVYFENVGGRVLDAVLPLLNNSARVPVCGVVSQYNGDQDYPGETRLSRMMRDTLVKGLTWRGFIVTSFNEYRGEFLTMMAPLVKSGAIVSLNDVVEGLEKAPGAFISMLGGGNRGKLIVKIS